MSRGAAVSSDPIAWTGSLVLGCAYSRLATSSRQNDVMRTARERDQQHHAASRGLQVASQTHSWHCASTRREARNHLGGVQRTASSTALQLQLGH